MGSIALTIGTSACRSSQELSDPTEGGLPWQIPVLSRLAFCASDVGERGASGVRDLQVLVSIARKAMPPSDAYEQVVPIEASLVGTSQ